MKSENEDKQLESSFFIVNENMNKRLTVGIISTLILALTIAFIIQPKDEVKDESKPKPKQIIKVKEFTYGFIDFQRLQIPLKDNIDLLKAKQLRLELELKEAMKPIIITPPKVDDKAFKDSVWQKNSQTTIAAAAEIEKRKRQAADEYRKATEAEYIRLRDESNDEYMNETLNIKLKLQNADVMRLSEDEKKQLENRLEEIRIERNKLQKELIDKWTQDIAQHAEDAVKDDIELLKKQTKEKIEQEKLQALKAQEDVQNRNAEIMRQATELKNRQIQRQSLKVQLDETKSEINKAEDELFNVLSNYVSKLAVIHNLKMIWISSNDHEHGGKVFFTSKTLDITDELNNEMRK